MEPSLSQFKLVGVDAIFVFFWLIDCGGGGGVRGRVVVVVVVEERRSAGERFSLLFSQPHVGLNSWQIRFFHVGNVQILLNLRVIDRCMEASDSSGS